MSDIQPTFTSSVNGVDYRFVQTCGACPEQYDVFKNDVQVAYLRVRHGGFRADLRNSRGPTVFRCDVDGDGEFDEGEFDLYVPMAMQLVELALAREERQRADEPGDYEFW